MEPTCVPEVVRVRNPRPFEIAWLAVIAVLAAAGGPLIFHTLAMHRLAGSLVMAAAIALTALAIRRAFTAGPQTDRSEVTKYVAYCCAAVLGLVAVAGKQHWAIGSCIAALEVAIVFDLITVAARPRTAEE